VSRGVPSFRPGNAGSTLPTFSVDRCGVDLDGRCGVFSFDVAAPAHTQRIADWRVAVCPQPPSRRRNGCGPHPAWIDNGWLSDFREPQRSGPCIYDQGGTYGDLDGVTGREWNRAIAQQSFGG